MKKAFRPYLIFWIVLVALFNVVCFVPPEMIGGVSKYTGAFWPCYAILMATFLAHLVLIYRIAGSSGPKQNTVNDQVSTISFLQLGVMVAVGLICMLVPAIPAWIGVIVSCVVLGLSILFLSSVKTVGENAFNANVAINERTAAINDLRADARMLVSRAAYPEAKAVAEKINEALRFSDPTSSSATEMYEAEIKTALEELKEVLSDPGKQESLQAAANKIELLISERNIACRNNK